MVAQIKAEKKETQSFIQYIVSQLRIFFYILQCSHILLWDWKSSTGPLFPSACVLVGINFWEISSAPLIHILNFRLNISSRGAVPQPVIAIKSRGIKLFSPIYRISTAKQGLGIITFSPIYWISIAKQGLGIIPFSPMYRISTAKQGLGIIPFSPMYRISIAKQGLGIILSLQYIEYPLQSKVWALLLSRPCLEYPLGNKKEIKKFISYKKIVVI